MKTVKLGEENVAEVILGQSPPSSAYNGTGHGLPFFQGKADFGLLHPIPRVWCDAGQKFAKAGDVLMSVRAPVGDVNVALGDCVIGRGIAAIRAGIRSDPWFLYFALAYSKPILESRATGSTFASVNKATLVDLDIPLPEMPEQVAIGSVLRLITEKIEQENLLITTAQDIKRVSMRDLFTRGLRGEPQKETELGLVPESWDIVTLGTLGRIGNGSTPKKSVRDYWEGGTFPWLTSAKVYDRDIEAADQFVTKTALDECHLPIVKPGAVLVAITGQGKTLGHCAVLRIEATINQHVAYLQTDTSKADSGFIRGYLETQYDYLRQVAAGGGSTKGALTCSFLRSLSLPLPEIKEQREIVAVLDAIDRKIDLHRKKRAVLEELFKALLHKLMTGEIRVDELDLSALDRVEAECEEAVA
ncbi:restriction endonuclease subunit S [Sulfurivermis fontis]|uniref:restriction endonuclease subunit S n=1 Tax=Sulfurivermis fontis TaxID=1972068 RepID=UPI000FD6FBE8|nr:restriction endonuclease subunit S [Sulfurivermis fontis]